MRSSLHSHFGCDVTARPSVQTLRVWVSRNEKISNCREIWEKNSQTKSANPTNLQWSCQPFRGRGKKGIWHLSKCHRSKEWLARFHHVVVFKTKVLHFKIENTPIKDTTGKRKFKTMLSFLFANKRTLFAIALSFEEFNLVFYTADRSAWLVLNQQGSEVFEDTLGTFRTQWSKKSTFLKRNFCIYKGFMDVFYILTSAWKKNHKMCIWNWFFAMCSTDSTCVNATI